MSLGVNDMNWTNYSGDLIHPNNTYHKMIDSRLFNENLIYGQYDTVKGN